MSNRFSGRGRIEARRSCWHRTFLKLIPILCGFLLLVGCKSGPDTWSFSMKNPFKSSLASDGGRSEKGATDGGREFAQQLTQGRTLEKTGKYREARKVYEKLIVAHPDGYEPYHRLGVVADRQKRYREAQALYAQAIRREPGNADLFNDLGYSFFLQGKLEKAEVAMLKAVSLSPSDARYRNNLGMVLAHMERYEEALAEFRRAGSDADAYYNLAFVLTAKNRLEDATDCFRLALAADPGHEPSRRALESSGEREESPYALADNGPIIENGVRWVPYSEDGEAGLGVQQATMESSLYDNGRLAPSVRNSTQAGFRNGRALLSRRMYGGEL
jgi:Flp pilus assembly protein TadD